MQSFKFKRLLVISNSEKSGNLFQFSSQLNLITAADNNVGKSTVVKLLYWTLGCDVSFDTTWENLDCKTIVTFEIGGWVYSAYRYKTEIKILDAEGTLSSYPKITGDFSEMFAELVKFRALLPNRKETDLETPPPAYYFLPFYIDQKKSWTKPWDSFERLVQYSNWKPTIVKYHTGLLKSSHFELEAEKYDIKAEKKILSSSIVRLELAVDIIDDYTPELTNAVTADQEKFNSLTEEIRKDLFGLVKEQEEVLDNYAKLESEKAQLENQYTFAAQIIKDLELDYQFSVENIDGDTLECPICGTVHENSVVERTSLLVDKQQAEMQFQGIEEKLSKVKTQLEKVNAQLGSLRLKITNLNEKYIVEDTGLDAVNFQDIIENVAGNSIKEKVNQDLTRSLFDVRSFDLRLKDISKSQKALQSKKGTNEIITFFTSTFSEYARMLNTAEVNLSAIKSPLDYGKVVKEGGAAENVRVTLAYNLAIYSTVVKYGSATSAALVMDTPNQHEQSDTNYTSIINLILKYFSKDTQVILCAMENEHLALYQENANIIRLDESKILKSELFEELRIELKAFEV